MALPNLLAVTAVLAVLLALIGFSFLEGFPFFDGRLKLSSSAYAVGKLAHRNFVLLQVCSAMATAVLSEGMPKTQYGFATS